MMQTQYNFTFLPFPPQTHIMRPKTVLKPAVGGKENNDKEREQEFIVKLVTGSLVLGGFSP